MAPQVQNEQNGDRTGEVKNAAPQTPPARGETNENAAPEALSGSSIVTWITSSQAGDIKCRDCFKRCVWPPRLPPRSALPRPWSRSGRSPRIDVVVAATLSIASWMHGFCGSGGGGGMASSSPRATKWEKTNEST
eukprot:gene12041-biopygen19922